MKAEIVTPVLTIFSEDGKIDYEGNLKMIHHLAENKIDGVVPLGSTGEFTSLSFEEKSKFLDFYISEVGDAMKVLPGTGCPNVEDTIALSKSVLKRGVEGVLIIGQYYYAMTQEEIYHYYSYLASRIEGNIYLYNFPARTGTDITPETVLRLLRNHKNIVGMKESVSSFSHTRQIMQMIQDEFPDFKMYSGFDDQFLDNVDYGGKGSIGAISNILPQFWSDWVAARNDGKEQEIRKKKKQILSLMKLYDLESNCSGLFKELLKARGLDISTATLFPFEKVSKDSIKEGLKLIHKVLEE